MPELPIRLVTFDLYDTLIELHPTRWDRLSAILESLSIPADAERLRIADVAAEDFYTEMNTVRPIRDRPADEREAFRREHLRRWLRAAGVVVDEQALVEIRRRYLSEFDAPAVRATVGSGYRVFPDVVPTMQALREAGIKTAVISNADRDVTALCAHFEFAHEMDLIVTSAIVGWEKPDVRTFQAAFEPLGVEPAEVLHIGDQPRSDVVGASAAGMRASLIDRYARLDQADFDVPVFRNFAGLLAHVEDVNAAQLAGRG